MLIPKIYPVTCHTDHVGQQTTFVAIKGFATDGSSFIKTALEKGAQQIIIQEDQKTQHIEELCCQYSAKLIIVPDTRKTLAELSSNALGNPARKLKIIGITGTKGKTTTTFIVDHLLQKSGYQTALLGTIKNKILDQEVDSTNTTPNSDYLHMFFDSCIKAGVSHVTMEVSSHALSLDRTHGMQFDVVCFTNLAPEHMDFYATLDDYFQAKAKLFSQVKPGGSIIINIDNEWGNKAYQQLKESNYINKNNISVIPMSSQPQQPTEGIHFDIAKNNLAEGLKVVIESKTPQQTTTYSIHSSKIFGAFNAYNLSMAFIVCKQLGISEHHLYEAIEFFHGVPGRLQLHTLKNGAKAFVDYAHNPSSFEEVLKSLRPLSKHLIVVFGCGGNKDTTKRPVMGALAATYADKVILTDDNPRMENREQIVQEILDGVPESKKHSIICQLDRRKAIKTAVDLSDKESIIAILGKGHEQYYVIQNERLFFDDFQEIKNF